MNRLSYRNNWECFEFYSAGERIRDVQQVSINGKVYKTQKKTVYSRVYDHGHEYDARTTDYTITEKVFGVDIKFRLTELMDEGVKVLV